MNTTFSLRSLNTSVETRLSHIVIAILFWIAKRWNKHNKFVNVWMRSNKDMTVNGPATRAAVDMSADGRARIRFRVWVIYIGYSNRTTKSHVA